MRQLDLPRATAPKITEPAGPDVAGPAEKTRLHKCKVCDVKYKLAAIAARHFNSSHSDLKKDAETWRQYIEEVWE